MMRWLVVALLGGLVLCCVGCATIGRANEILDQAREVVALAKQTVTEIDADKSGSISREELVAWVLGGGAAGSGLIGALVKILKRFTAKK